MRVPVLAVLAVATLQFAVPAKAQTYDPRYPYCLQIYDDIVHYTFECGYTSMPQCQASASGRNAQCVANPYYGGPRGKPAPRRTRPPPQ